MSVTDAELARILEEESTDWARETPGREAYPFHLIVLKAVVRLGLDLGPKAPADLVADARAEILKDKNFKTEASSEKTLGLLLNRLRGVFVDPVEPAWPRITVVVCKEKVRDSSGRVLSCCSEEQVKRGCGIEVGTQYLAATNGINVTFAGLLTSRKSRVRDQAFAGSEVSSLLLFTMLHEFGHVLHVVPRTFHLFDDAYLFYTRCARVLPREVRKRNRLVLSHVEVKEFFASLFAISSMSGLKNRAAETASEQ